MNTGRAQNGGSYAHYLTRSHTRHDNKGIYAHWLCGNTSSHAVIEPLVVTCLGCLKRRRQTAGRLRRDLGITTWADLDAMEATAEAILAWALDSELGEVIAKTWASA